MINHFIQVWGNCGPVKSEDKITYWQNTSNLHNSQKLHTSDKMLNNLYHLVTVQIVNSLGENISLGHLKIFIFLVMVNTFEEDAGFKIHQSSSNDYLC